MAERRSGSAAQKDKDQEAELDNLRQELADAKSATEDTVAKKDFEAAQKAHEEEVSQLREQLDSFKTETTDTIPKDALDAAEAAHNSAIEKLKVSHAKALAERDQSISNELEAAFTDRLDAARQEAREAALKEAEALHTAQFTTLNEGEGAAASDERLKKAREEWEAETEAKIAQAQEAWKEQESARRATAMKVWEKQMQDKAAEKTAVNTTVVSGLARPQKQIWLPPRAWVIRLLLLAAIAAPFAHTPTRDFIFDNVMAAYAEGRVIIEPYINPQPVVVDPSPAEVLGEIPLAPVSTLPTTTVSVEFANVRGGPSTNDRVVGTLGGGDQVEIIGSQGGWRNVRFGDGAEGWIFRDLLTPAPAQPAQEIPQQ